MPLRPGDSRAPTPRGISIVEVFMKSLFKPIVLAMAAASLVVASLNAQAQTLPPIPITADEAFDAVTQQKDPLSGVPGRVLLVDVRTHAEFHWVGAAAMVKAITLKNGGVIVPDWGKVKIEHEGKFLVFRVGGKNERIQVKTVAKLDMAGIAKNIPYQTWNDATFGMALNPTFGAEVEALAGDDRPVLILFCRSGGRTDAGNAVAKLYPEKFSAIYEIDQPNAVTNHGGFEGSSYSDVFNGYRGYPERETLIQSSPSVSWKDAGLPIKIGLKQ